MQRLIILLCVFFLLPYVGIFAQTNSDLRIYRLDIKEDIGPNAWRTVNNAYTNAESDNFDLMLIELNTFGGMVNFADSIRSRILDSPLESMVFINHNAASAGALISLACDKIYMSKG